MALVHRRGFLLQSGLAAAGLPFWSSPLFSQLARKIKITEIEAHQILPPYHDYHAEWLFRYQGLNSRLRTIYIVKTDAGIEGYGENWGQPWSDFKDYLGTTPFDWINDPRNLPMNMAVYDLMGKALGLPAWKLIGPRVRSWVPIAAWTMSQPPRQMAEEVRQLSKRGYRWMKYHVDVLQNVVDQTAAMQEVAPRGFRVHYDFNEDSNFEAVYPVLKELERFPIAGRIEDPIRSIDQDGYRLLRQKCAIPILIHHGPADVFMRKGLSDGFMASHAGVGSAMKLAAMAESANTPFLLQMAGGTINQAFLAHQAAVYPHGLSGPRRPLQPLGGRRDRRIHAGGGRQRGGSEGTRSRGEYRPEEAGAAGPGAPTQTDTLPGQGALQTRAAPLFPFRSRRSGRQHQVPESAGIRAAVLRTRPPCPGTGPGLRQSGGD